MELFLQQIFSGIANGMIYGILGLSLVMVYNATHQINFGQGEMATFCTSIAWFLLEKGLPYWPVFFFTLAISFCIGVLCERVFYKKVEQSAPLVQIMVFIGIFLLFNGLSGLFFGYEIKAFPSPFTEIHFLKNIYITPHQFGTIIVNGILLTMMFLFFKYTKLGLAIRAAAEDPVVSSLMGIQSSWMLAIGWGLASLIGAVAGMFVAPSLFLDPNMMLSVLTYSFAAAILGGISSPAGTVAGGVMIGVVENLLGTYIPFIGSELKLSAILILIAFVLVLKPSGLFEKQLKEKV